MFYFNPRSPSGLRQTVLDLKSRRYKFQSTQPEWAATSCTNKAIVMKLSFQSTQPEWAATGNFGYAVLTDRTISIHAARVGCD